VRSAAAPPSPRSISTDVLDVLLQGAAGVGLLACQVSCHLCWGCVQCEAHLASFHCLGDSWPLA
jgi:hypothetical protein